MMDVRSENLVTLSKAGRVVNPTRPPHLATLWRWAGRGVRGTKLETCLVGGVRYTSEEAIARFLARLNEPGAVPAPVSSSAERAGAALAARGA